MLPPPVKVLFQYQRLNQSQLGLSQTYSSYLHCQLLGRVQKHQHQGEA